MGKRLPNGWIPFPDDLIGSIVLEDSPFYITITILGELVDLPILMSGEQTQFDMISLKGADLTRTEVVTMIVTSVEKRSYRFLLRDGFLLVRDRPIRGKEPASLKGDMIPPRIKAQLRRFHDESEGEYLARLCALRDETITKRNAFFAELERFAYSPLLKSDGTWETEEEIKARIQGVAEEIRRRRVAKEEQE